MLSALMHAICDWYQGVTRQSPLNFFFFFIFPPRGATESSTVRSEGVTLLTRQLASVGVKSR